MGTLLGDSWLKPYLRHRATHGVAKPSPQSQRHSPCRTNAASLLSIPLLQRLLLVCISVIMLLLPISLAYWQGCRNREIVVTTARPRWEKPVANAGQAVLEVGEGSTSMVGRVPLAEKTRFSVSRSRATRREIDSWILDAILGL